MIFFGIFWNNGIFFSAAGLVFKLILANISRFFVYPSIVKDQRWSIETLVSIVGVRLNTLRIIYLKIP